MITDDMLASLRANDDRLDNLFLYLDEYSLPPEDDDDADASLSSALYRNTQVKAVDCDMHLDTMTEALGSLMTSIGRLINLQRLRCSSSGDYAVTMAAMAKALQATTSSSTGRLVSLDLANFLLQDDTGCESESPAQVSYLDFVTALTGHSTLQYFNLGFGYSSFSSAKATMKQEASTAAFSTLTPLLQALRTIPTLTRVRLDGAGFASQQALTPAGLTLLLSSASITTLEVHDFDLSPDHFEAAGHALATNTCLKVLSLSCHNYYACQDNGDNQKQHPATKLCLALRTNTYLEKLYLPQPILQGKNSKKQSNLPDIAALVEFLQALEVNPSVKQLQITGGGDSSLTPMPQTATAAFRHMLQHNYSLESIQLPWFACEEWQAEIQLHTKLNAMGRGRLVRGTAASYGSTALPQQWMEALEQVRDDLSCLFHLLLLNPLLCDEVHCGVK
jgi:hypothetical protein